MEIRVDCPFCNSPSELQIQTVTGNTQQFKCTKCGAGFVKIWYGGGGGGAYSIGAGDIGDGMDKR